MRATSRRRLERAVRVRDFVEVALPDLHTFPARPAAPPAQSAPDHLKKYLRVQVEVLDDIVAVVSGEGNRTIKTGKYRNASANFVLASGKDIG